MALDEVGNTLTEPQKHNSVRVSKKETEGKNQSTMIVAVFEETINGNFKRG